MKKYFLHDGNNQIGPFDKLELIENKIKVDSPIWCEGMTVWTVAGEVDELKDLFKIQPPPFIKPDKGVSYPKFKTSNRNIQLFSIIGVILILVIAFFVYTNSQQKSKDIEVEAVPTDQKLEQEKKLVEENNTPEKLRENLLEKEQAAPLDYLTIQATLVPNVTRTADLFHHTETNGFRFEGSIKNSASLANYKDVRVIINYFTKTGTLISSQEIMIPEYFNSNSTIDLAPFKDQDKLYFYPPEGAQYENTTFQIKSAAISN